MKLKKPQKLNYLERLGLQPTPGRLLADDGTPRGDVRIVGHRARFLHSCAAKMDCPDDAIIDLDEVYVEYAIGPDRYNGKALRYHPECALLKNIVLRTTDVIDLGNDRRGAIMAKRKRLAQEKK